MAKAANQRGRRTRNNAADAHTTATNGKPGPASYEGVPPTSTTGFTTLRIPPAKYRDLYHDLDSIDNAYFYTLPEKHVPFLTLKYDPRQDRPKDNRGQEDLFEDSAVELATPGVDSATSQLQLDQEALPDLTGDSLPLPASQYNNSFAHSGLTRSIQGDPPNSRPSLDQDSAVNTRDPTPYQGDQSRREFTFGGTPRQPSAFGQPATATAAAGPATRKKSKVLRLKLPLGYHLDENMQPVHDPNDVSGILKGVVDDLYDVQSKTHGFIPETQSLLIDKIGDISDKLARLKDVTDPKISPNNPIHNVRIAPEIVDYVDEGRNPDIFTREFVENVQRGNAVINGKKQGLRDFSVILAQKMKEGLPGVEGSVDRIMQNAGLEKELAEAEAKAQEKQKTPT